MKNYKLLVAYDGTDFCGWQIQPNGPTIQSHLQDAFKIVMREKIQVIGSGRTDAGVHALAQVANFKTTQSLNLYKVQQGVNALLPDSIRILNLIETDLDFHSQYSAKGKIYHYHLWLEAIESPFLKKYRLHVRHKINLERLKLAGKQFIGTHDFTSFANEAHKGTASHDPIRTIHRVDLVPQEGGLRLEFEGDGFLYKMVRNMVGAMLEVAEGKREVEDIPLILKAKDRRYAGKAAPPQALFLAQVHY